MKELTNIMALELTPLSSSWHALVTSSIKSVTEHHIHLHKFRVLGRRVLQELIAFSFIMIGLDGVGVLECWSFGLKFWSA